MSRLIRDDRTITLCDRQTLRASKSSRSNVREGIHTELPCFADTVSRLARATSLLSINKLRLDALRRLLPAHVAGERVHQRAQISELADGARMAGAGCDPHPVHGITRLQRRSRGHGAVSSAKLPVRAERALQRDLNAAANERRLNVREAFIARCRENGRTELKSDRKLDFAQRAEKAFIARRVSRKGVAFNNFALIFSFFPNYFLKRN